MKIKLEIHPSFLNSCYLEIHEQTLSIDIHPIRFMVVNETESKSWKFPIEETYVKSLTILTQKIIEESKLDERLILDGVSLKCGVYTETSEVEYKFRCPEFNTKELELVLKYFDLISNLKIDTDLINYFELLEGYFGNKLPVKEFDEQPYRLRIYGSLSIYEMEGLKEVINRVCQNENINLVIDMRNFQGMGTALYECFEPLKRLKDLKIWVNNASLECMNKIGFELTQMDRTKNDA